MSLNLSDGGLSSNFARSIVIPLKLSSSSGRFLDSHAGVRRTGSVESLRPELSFKLFMRISLASRFFL